MKLTLRPRVVATLVGILIAMVTLGPAVHAQDVPLAQRLPAVCAPSQFVYYNATLGTWSCSTAGPKVLEGGADPSTTSALAVGSLIDQTSTASGTVQSTEYTLNSVILKAYAFNQNARGIRCVAYGTGAANANAKNYKFYFGSTAVATVTGSTDNAKDYLAELVVVRTGTNTQAGYATITSDVGAPDAFSTTTALAQVDGADITVAFKSANTAAAAASATGKGLVCAFFN